MCVFGPSWCRKVASIADRRSPWAWAIAAAYPCHHAQIHGGRRTRRPGPSARAEGRAGRRRVPGRALALAGAVVLAGAVATALLVAALGARSADGANDDPRSP